MAQLGRVSPEQIFVGIWRGSNLGPLPPQFRSVSTTLQGLPLSFARIFPPGPRSAQEEEEKEEEKEGEEEE